MKKYLLLIVLCLSTTYATIDSLKTILGRVQEIETKNPINNCLVYLSDIKNDYNQLKITDSLGYFSFKTLPNTVAFIKVKKIGYDGAELEPINLSIFDSLKLKVILTPIPHITEEVVVEAERISKILSQHGFYERQAEGLGRYYSHKEIQQYKLNDFHQLINLIPRLRISSDGAIEGTFLRPGLNGSGDIHIYIDGVKFEMPRDPDGKVYIGNLVDTNTIAGIEFYSRASNVPVKYKTFNSSSGVLLIWTK